MLLLTSFAQASEIVEIGGAVWLAEHAGQGARADATGRAAGLRARLRPSPRWAIEGLAGWNPSGPEAALEAVSFLGDPARELVPFLTAGAGGDARGGAFLSAGPGLDIVLGPHADLRLDARARLDARGSVALVFSTALALHGGRRVDLDGDGIAGSADGCPEHAEDRDDFQDGDGCPDPDDDLDGREDSRDACPRSAEDRDGFLDADGCPEPDNDGDGLDDDKDACIALPEDPDGWRDGDGCPDPDDDEDGVPDDQDACARVPEDRDGFADSDGCPDPDNDSDGVPDASDAAPEAPETLNGWEDTDGRPDAVPRLIARFLGIQPRVRFEGEALMPRAEDVLDSLADVLDDLPAARIVIGVQAPDGALVRQRADVIRERLAGHGQGLERVRVHAWTGEELVTVSLLDARAPWPTPPMEPTPAPSPETPTP